MKKITITILRVVIGWHFLYEGIAKLIADDWSAGGYLSDTRGFLSGFYHWIASSPLRLEVVDIMNIWGLILIGLGLFVGLCTRWASLAASLLLLLYYFAYPPFGISLLGGDGTLFIVDKIFIEAAALMFIFFCKDTGYGIDAIVRSWIAQKKVKTTNTQSSPIAEPVTTASGGQAPQTDETESLSNINSRREALKNMITIPVLGAIGWGAFSSNKKYDIDASTGATIRVNRVSLGELKGELPKGKIGGMELSRLIMGGNLIGGWAHARDLIYAGSLFKAYNSERKIFETLMLCEEAGIDTINIGYPTMSTMVKYRKLTGSKMKVIIQVGIDEKNDDIYDNVTQAIDGGMDMIQLQGNWCEIGRASCRERV